MQECKRERRIVRLYSSGDDGRYHNDDDEQNLDSNDNIK